MPGLPNPGMDFTPFDTLPAADLDKIVENIEALADGSALEGLDVGNLTAYSNPYKFHVVQTSGISVGTADTLMSYGTEVFDTNSNFASNQYTAPVSGFYLFYAYARVAASASTTSAFMNIYKNGSDFTRLAFEQDTNQAYGLGGTIMLQLTATNTVRIAIGTTGAATATLASGTELPYFGGYLISRT